MPRFLKIAAITVGSIIGLLALIIVIISLVIDPNSYKPQIQDAVAEQTGRQLNLSGDIKLAFFPWLGLDVGHAELGNAPGFGAEPFAVLDQVAVRVKLLPLLTKHVELSEIILRGVKVHASQHKDGSNSWDDLAAGKPRPKDAPPPAPAVRLISLGVPELKLQDLQVDLNQLMTNPENHIGTTVISNATIELNDLVAKSSQSVSGLNVKTGAIKLAPPMPAVPLEVTLAAHSGAPATDAQIKLTTSAQIDLEKQNYRLATTTLTVQFTMKEPNVTGTATLKSDIDLDLQQQFVHLADLQLDVNKKLTDLGIDTAATTTADVRFNLATQQLNVAKLAINGKSTGGSLPESGLPFSLQSDIAADLNQQTLNVTNLQLKAMDINATGKVTGKTIIDNPAFAASLAVAPMNPRQVLTTLKQTLPEMADQNALTKADLAVDVDASTSAIDLRKLTAHLDETTLTASATVSNFSNPAIKFAAQLDKIDVDRYLAPPPPKDQKTTPPPPGEKAPPAAGKTATAPASEIPLEPLRQLRLDGKLTAGHIKANNLVMESLNVGINAKDGLIQITPLTAKLYSGEIKGDTTLDARGKELKVSLNESLSGIKAGPLLKDLMGDDKLQGTGSVSLTATGSGNTSDKIISTLTGKGQLSFRDGAVKGLNIGHMLRVANAKIKSQPEPTETLEQTDFSELTGTLDITNGVITNKDLSAKAPVLRVMGQGTADIPNQVVDYTVTAEVVNTSKGQGGKELADLAGFPLPISIKGPLLEPKIKVDYEGYLKNLAKQRKDAAVQKEKDKLKEKADTQLKKLQESDKFKELQQQNPELEQKLQKGLDRLFKR